MTTYNPNKIEKIVDLNDLTTIQDCFKIFLDLNKFTNKTYKFYFIKNEDDQIIINISPWPSPEGTENLHKKGYIFLSEFNLKDLQIPEVHKQHAYMLKEKILFFFNKDGFTHEQGVRLFSPFPQITRIDLEDIESSLVLAFKYITREKRIEDRTKLFFLYHPGNVKNDIYPSIQVTNRMKHEGFFLDTMTKANFHNQESWKHYAKRFADQIRMMEKKAGTCEEMSKEDVIS